MKTNSHDNSVDVVSLPEGMICAKASMLLHNVPPALLILFSREHRSEWAYYNIDAYSASYLKVGSTSFPGLRPKVFMEPNNHAFCSHCGE